MSAQTDQQAQDSSLREIEELVRQLADAQQRGDVDELDSLLSEDFKLVGPFGFVVGKPQWLEQFRPQALQISTLEWDELDVRTYGPARLAIVIGRLVQQATYAGRPSDGTFRVTVMAIRGGDRWRIAGAQYSAIAPPPRS
jgi:uncharacterized protein (TIGR02246 family)